MGQSTFGVLYGVQANPPADAEDGWDDLLGKYGKKRPDSEWHFITDQCFVGYWVAVGGSGKDGVPHLSLVPFALADFAMTSPYDVACKDAAKKWQAFQKWAKKKDFNFDEPKLFLLETEVA